MSKPSYNNNQQHPHRHTKFFLSVSLFVIAMSILAVYSTIGASEYDLKKDDMHTHAIVHRYHFQPSSYDLKAIIRKSVCIKKGIPPKESSSPL